MLPSGPLILDRNTTSACVALRVIDNPAQQGDLTTRLGLKIEDPQFRITSNNATITFLDQPGQCPLSLILIGILLSLRLRFRGGWVKGRGFVKKRGFACIIMKYLPLISALSFFPL